MLVMYGIKNCDSVKKARTWLEARHIAYRFHDYRIDGLDAALLQRFVDALGLDAVLNQRSTSWRQLDDDQKSDLTPDKAVQLMLAVPTLIKRPILDDGQQLIVGFNPDQYPTE
ncbi:ArsC family reductase [Methylomonas sp. OY6]|uniref:ArsC family reductase n=1 Tax=Methylomonas defluvii TaxID=3045149 RepID=A0ABU4U8U7_9GAMM|nr:MULTISPECIES: ArsC family reductase [unclassified Methylomonas]MDX8125841.1 ArsC family reductase [Methylomonas sp. OY6]PKD41193.1 ArsC family reductase [Methylomonas sp. Kb3]